MVALDTSVLVAALDAADPDHDASRALLLAGKPAVFLHALSETFSILTGGSLGKRVAAAEVAAILHEHLAPRVRLVTLGATDVLKAYKESTARGIRGGAIYDYLHMVAARKAGATRIYTLNLGDFLAFHRRGDPEPMFPAA